MKTSTRTNSLGTTTSRFINDVADRMEVTFITRNFYCDLTERMLWKPLERDMGRQLNRAYNEMFGDTMKLIDKYDNVINHKRYAITELKRYYYKNKESMTLSSRLYDITIIINGYIK